MGSQTEAVTTVVVGGLTASPVSGAGYAILTLITGATSIVVSVAGNDRAMRVYARSFGRLDAGAVL